jgi:hypothetical protein
MKEVKIFKQDRYPSYPYSVGCSFDVDRSWFVDSNLSFSVSLRLKKEINLFCNCLFNLDGILYYTKEKHKFGSFMTFKLGPL